MDRVAGKVSSYCCRRHRRFRPRRVWKAHGGTGISLVQSISDRSRDRCASPWVPLICAKVERWIYLIPDEYNLKDRATSVASMLRRLSWPVNWAKLITMNWSLHLNSMACRLPLYLFTHLSNSISRYERHYLSEYGLSLIHDFYLLQYYLQKYKIKSRKNFIRVMH